MTDRRALVRAPATSWSSVLGGWVATIGASVIFAPLVAGLIAAMGQPTGTEQLALAAPVVLGVLLSYLVGGYIAGRMAGYRTSWHGMMTAFFSLFILLVVLLIGGLADNGVFANSGIRSLGDIIPGVRDLNVSSFGNALSFGALLGFLAAIFGGWLGGLLAPTVVVPMRTVPRPAAVPVATPASKAERRVIEQRDRRAQVPAYGRKGGERDDEPVVDDVHRPTSNT